MSIYFRTKIMLAHLEATYGVDAGLTAAHGILAKDLTIKPMEGQDLDRDLELPHMGSVGSIPEGLHVKMSYKVEAVPSGAAGVAPAWGKLLRACGCAETIVADTSVTYNPVSDGFESLTHSMQIGGTLYKMLGVRGTAKLNWTARKVPEITFDLTGLWSKPVEAARVTPTNLSDFKDPKVVSKVNTPLFTLGGTALHMRSCELDLGNQVSTDFLVGHEEVEIEERKDMIATTVRAVPLTTFDPYDLALSGADAPLVLTHGTLAGLITTLEASRAQVQRADGLEDASGKAEWPLRLLPRPSVGNDQWTLALT